MEANEMGGLPIGRLLRKISMPLLFSMLVQVLYGLVDSLYVARLGDNALTAISLCMSAQFLLLMLNASEAMMEIGIPALRFVAAAFLFTTTTQILPSFLQGMGQGTASFIVATAQTVFILLFAWILVQTGSATLVFPLMEVVRFVIAVILVRHTYKGKIANLQTA